MHLTPSGENFRRVPYAHQLVGIEKLTARVTPEDGRVLPGCFFLGDEMRLGKTKQVIDSALCLFRRNEIDRVIVVCPAPVRSVWFDPEFGELAKHLWEGTPAIVREFHQKVRTWKWEGGEGGLEWFITNYEYLAHGVKRLSKGWSGPNLEVMRQMAGPKTLLILDESSWVKSHNALRSRACLSLRRNCGWVWLLNGTPVSHSPLDMYSQAFIMDRHILGCEHVYEFKGRYAVEQDLELRNRARPVRTVVGWKNLDDLQRRMAPYMLRRLRNECMDLPPKLEPVTLTATLSSSTWKLYCELRDQMIVELEDDLTLPAPIAVIKVMRLAQICSGFLVGLESENICPNCEGTGCEGCFDYGFVKQKLPAREVGSEKLNVFLSWVGQRLDEDPNFRMVVWCRFRWELEKLQGELKKLPLIVAAIHGGQSKEEREYGLRLMHPDNVYEGAAILLGTQGTGGVGVNMAGAHEVVRFSHGTNLGQHVQAEDRPMGPGQTQPVSYHDVIAVGPRGQQTVEHTIVKSLRERRNLAEYTTSAWVSTLRKERDRGEKV